MKFWLVFILVVVVAAAAGCRSTSEKRVNKDIGGINEQLYDLEKEQIKDHAQIEELKKRLDELKTTQENLPLPGEKKNKNSIEESEREKIYKDGYKYYLEQNYTEAIKILAQLTDHLEDPPLTDSALYWLADSYFKTDKQAEALKYYQLLYRYFPFSEKADFALYKIGSIYFSMQDFSRAGLAFSRLVQEYPNSDLNKAASMKLNQINTKERRKK